MGKIQVKLINDIGAKGISNPNQEYQICQSIAAKQIGGL